MRTVCSTGKVLDLPITLVRPGKASLSSATANVISVFMYSFLSVVLVIEMKEPATLLGHGWRLIDGGENDANWHHSLGNGFTFGWKTVDFVTNKRPEIRFALDEEFTTNPCKLMRPVFCHLKCELLDLGAVNQHRSSSPVPLYLSWERTHSCCSMSCRGPR